MGSLHHAHATTTVRVRKEIQDSSATIAVLAARYHINPKTVWHWKHAGRVEDAQSGPRFPRSSVRAPEEEQVIGEFRRLTRFALDDLYISLKPYMPALSRSNLHRCLVRHGLNRRIPEENPRPGGSKKKKFKDYDIGYVHIDITDISGEAAKAQALNETNNVLEAVRQCSVSRLIFTSTLTTIGFPAESGQLADETCPFSTTFPNNSYLMAKIAMEEAVLKASRNGVPAVVLNPTAFFGPFDSKPTSGTQIIMIAKYQMPGYINGPTNVMDVRDVAIAHINAAERGRIGERYIIGNWNTSQKALNELIAKVAGVPAPKVPVPFFVARFGSKLGDWASRTLLHKKPPIPGFFVEPRNRSWITKVRASSWRT